MTSSRKAMGLASEEELKNIRINCLDSRAQNERQELEDATKATNQEGPFRDIGGHGFQIVYEKGNLCNFPITIVKYWGEVPTPTTLSSGSSTNAPKASSQSGSKLAIPSSKAIFSPGKAPTKPTSSDATDKEVSESESEDDMGYGLCDHMPANSSDITKITEDYYIVLEPQWE